MENVMGRFSFMTSGPTYVLQLPPGFNEMPELSSPLLSGIGGRSFDFRPQWRGIDTGDGVALSTTVQDRDGRNVEIYQMDDPLQWFLRWSLRVGVLFTHLREEDEFARIERLLQHLSIVEDERTGLPFLLPDPPIKSAVSAHPGYQELAAFSSIDGNSRDVHLQRPGYLAAGQVVSMPEKPAFLRAGTRLGIEVQVVSPTQTESKEILEIIIQSIKEA